VVLTSRLNPLLRRRHDPGNAGHSPKRHATPLVLHPELRLSPEQFALVCEANPDADLELSAGGHLISMTPTGGDTSARNTALLYALQHYARSQGGWKVLDSSGGFRLPVAVRLLRRSWLRPQPRCLPGAPRSLAGPHPLWARRGGLVGP